MKNVSHNVILSAEEETSILLEGDFDQNSYSKNLKHSFFQALAINTKLSNEIKFYEPKLSLYGGTDGLDCYKKLAHHFKKIGHKNTIYIVEIGYNQKTTKE